MLPSSNKSYKKDRKILFELHKHSEEMSIEEAESLISLFFNKYKKEVEVINKHVFLIYHISDNEALDHFIYKVNEMSNRMSMLKILAISIFDDKLLDREGKWYVKVYGDNKGVIRKRAVEYLVSNGRDVNLKGKNVLVAISDYDDYFLLIKERKEKDLYSREPQNRPGFVPYSLRPRIARALINIARVKAGNKVLDPFCGVGGILLESSLMHIYSFGGDIKLQNIRKTLDNIEYYGVKHNMFVILSDASLLPYKYESFDAIVTDVPYGVMSPKKENKNIEDILLSAFDLVMEGGRMVVMSNRKELGDILIRKGISLYSSFGIKVRKSLTRYIFIFVK